MVRSLRMQREPATAQGAVATESKWGSPKEEADGRGPRMTVRFAWVCRGTVAGNPVKQRAPGQRAALAAGAAL
jgi:hypothetical protein